MTSADLRNSGGNKFSTYALTIAIVFLTYIVTSFLPVLISGRTLTTIPEMNAAFGKNKTLVFLLIPFVASLFVLLLIYRLLHGKKALRLFTSRTNFDTKRFFLSFAIWGSVLGLFLAISVVGGKEIYWNFHPETFFPLLLISLFVIPLQTTFEEVFFRGYLMQGLDSLFKRKWISVVLTGTLFGLMHGANPEVMQLGKISLIYYILTGIFLGALAALDRGLELSMGYHAINNIFAALFVTNDWQAFQTDALFIDKSAPALGWDSYVTIFVLQPLLVLLFGKIYQWKNWKKQLFEKQRN